MTRGTAGALLRAVLRRLAGAVLVVWAALTLVFFGIRLMPGSVEAVILGTHLNDPGLAEQVRSSLGLDRPVIEQYLSFLSGAIRGDFGRSYTLRSDVSEVLGSQIVPSLQLAGVSVLVALALVWIIVVTTAGASPRAARALSIVELVAICLPTFWVGSLLIMTFAFGLRLFPSSGANGPLALVLPVITLVLPVAGVLSQFAREEVARRLREPFITSAISRGISPFRLRAVHLVPHVAVSSLQLAGNMLGVLIGGAIVVETVFGRPGLGRVALSAVESQDTPVVLGVVMTVTVAYVIIAAVVDVAALLIDPRLRREPRR